MSEVESGRRFLACDLFQESAMSKVLLASYTLNVHHISIKFSATVAHAEYQPGYKLALKLQAQHQ